MRILIAPDAFKGSLSSLETAKCIQDGMTAVWPDCETHILPVADGGEGTVGALVAGTGGCYQKCVVSDPLGRPVEAMFGLLPDNTAVIEMAQASGLPLLHPAERNPRITSTYGTGEMIVQALDMGCRRILLGIGGSATNDGGAGMASALGVRLLDKTGRTLPSGGAALIELDSIDISTIDPRVRETEFLIASDVENPLCGENGASVVYGPQKGATPAMVAQLDAALCHYGAKLKALFGCDFASMAGAGAAGGLGAGLMAFCGGTMQSGVEVVFRMLNIESHVAQADLVITGEGRVDSTSASGKLLSGIGRLAMRHAKPAIAITGCVGAGWERLLDMGITALVPIADGPITLEQSLAQAPRLITQAATRTARLIQTGIGCVRF